MVPPDAQIPDLNAFVAVARAGGFRQAARALGVSPSGLSQALLRLETQLGVRLLHRTTRSVVATEQGQRLLDRLQPALAEVRSAVEAVSGATAEPSGTLKLNVPVNAARLILPAILPGFLMAHPAIRVEISADSGFVDVLSAGFDAGIRYDDRLDMDMIAVPIGPRTQRFATVAAPAYLDRHGRPTHPNDLLSHACLRDRSATGHMPPWEFERDGEVVAVDSDGPLVFGKGTTVDLALEAAVAGLGVLHLFEEWVRPYIASGTLEPILEPWWQSFSGPYLYFSGRRLLPPPLRAFVDYIRTRPTVGP